MTYKDQWATDENGEQFIFTVEMQRKLDEAGLPIEPAYIKELDLETGPPSRPSAPAAKPAPATDDGFAEPQTIQIDPQTGKYIGRMKWYNNKKGYGFLIRGGGEEIFFHKTGTVGNAEDYQEGQWVLYDVEETRKGPEATEIEPYEGDTDNLA